MSMSIYATHWILQFPSFGDSYSGCEWTRIVGQAVPSHIGTPTQGYGYESDDPYTSFLPPAVHVADEDETIIRAMVIVRENTEKVGLL